VYISNTAHDSIVDAAVSRGVHEKTKQLPVMSYIKYKIGVNKQDQLLSYYSIQSKPGKTSHFFNLTRANAHILHQMRINRSSDCIRSWKRWQKD
jgi:hypothetical protein